LIPARLQISERLGWRGCRLIPVLRLLHVLSLGPSVMLLERLRRRLQAHPGSHGVSCSWAHGILGAPLDPCAWSRNLSPAAARHIYGSTTAPRRCISHVGRPTWEIHRINTVASPYRHRSNTAWGGGRRRARRDVVVEPLRQAESIRPITPVPQPAFSGHPGFRVQRNMSKLQG
jgi:hypothetical protein